MFLGGAVGEIAEVGTAVGEGVCVGFPDIVVVVFAEKGLPIDIEQAR